MDSERERLEAEHAEVEGDLQDSLISWKLRHLRHEAARNSASAVLFAVMTIEGFVNAYGTRRLGEDYYKKHLERLRISEKISVLLLACGIAKLEQDDPLLKGLGRLFDYRNRLVHPKTKEVQGRLAPDVLGDDEVPLDTFFRTLERFADFMVEADPHTEWDIHAMRRRGEVGYQMVNDAADE